MVYTRAPTPHERPSVAKTTKPKAEVRVRIDPHFAVRIVADSDDRPFAHLTFSGPTARKALAAAKSHLVADRDVTMWVTNARLIEAVSWGAPIYPDDTNLLQQVLDLTGGIYLPADFQGER